jgi:hypothetical protein
MWKPRKERQEKRKSLPPPILVVANRHQSEPAVRLGSAAGLDESKGAVNGDEGSKLFFNMPTKKKKWSAKVTAQSDAMDLKKNVFKQSSPKKIAQSVKASATKSKRKKSTAKQSAMSMLSFYVNRAGKNLSPAQKKKLEEAKVELRKLPK